mmetsp:Transcript_40792/g.96161  ORF Transcript_40792/g.96161 Transcript_40792/m.96161 type:complete len:312 (-) Transcript_40792:59-994(-)
MWNCVGSGPSLTTIHCCVRVSPTKTVPNCITSARPEPSAETISSCCRTTLADMSITVPITLPLTLTSAIERCTPSSGVSNVTFILRKHSSLSAGPSRPCIGSILKGAGSLFRISNSAGRCPLFTTSMYRIVCAPGAIGPNTQYPSKTSSARGARATMGTAILSSSHITIISSRKSPSTSVKNSRSAEISRPGATATEGIWCRVNSRVPGGLQRIRRTRSVRFTTVTVSTWVTLGSMFMNSATAGNTRTKFPVVPSCCWFIPTVAVSAGRAVIERRRSRDALFGLRSDPALARASSAGFGDGILAPAAPCTS